MLRERVSKRVSPEPVAGSSKYEDELDQVSQEYRLTDREQEVLQGCAIGLTSDEIASRMNISPKTVKTCLGRIKVKMQAPSEANLIVMLLNAGARKGPRDLPIAPQAIADRHRKRPTRENGISALDAVVTRAIEVIGDRIEAMRWLGTPVRALNYATPISLLGTPEGLTRVADVLGQMEHGIW